MAETFYQNTDLYGHSEFRNKSRSSFDSIKDLVRDGLNEIRKNPTNESFRIWFEYSYKILDLSTHGNPRLSIDYMNYGLSLLNANIPPYEKFSKCLDYLIEIMRYL